MKKLLNISVIAALAILPLAANAADIDKDPGATTANAPVAQNAPKYALAEANANVDGVVATAGYVKGAYNAAIKAVNKVADMATNATNSANISYDGTTSTLSATNVQAAVDELASEKADANNVYTKSQTYTQTEVDNAIESGAVQTVTKGNGNGTISVDNGADVTIYDDTALAGRVSDNETHIGTLGSLQTTEKSSLVGAINEVKGTAGFAGTAAELTDTHFTPTDTTSAAKAANAAMVAAAAAQADVDAVETDLSTNYATKTGVTTTVTNALNAATVDISGLAVANGALSGEATGSVQVVDTWGATAPSNTPVAVTVDVSNVNTNVTLSGDANNIAVHAGTVAYPANQ